MQGRYGGGRTGDLGSIGGRQIEPEEYYHAVKEARLEYLLRYRTWPEDNASSRQMGYDPQRQAMNRLLLLKKLKDFKIEPSDQAVANQIALYVTGAALLALDRLLGHDGTEAEETAAAARLRADLGAWRPA